MSVNKSTSVVSGTAVPVGQTISPSYPVAEPVQAFAVQPVQAQTAVTASVMATNMTIGPQDQVCCCVNAIHARAIKDVSELGKSIFHAFRMNFRADSFACL
eukprot:4056271-Pleurochrysis_carterae.AAC.1